MLIGPARAQTAGQDTTIHERKENQQDRIANGVASGQLTAGETANLERKEANLNSETRTDRQANNGQLTAPEKAQINRQQNRLSQNIYNDKAQRRRAALTATTRWTPGASSSRIASRKESVPAR